MALRILSLLAVMATLIELGTAVDHIVGGTAGWATGNLATWASTRSFHVGDNLIFSYTSMHNVIEVPESDYDSCQATNLINVFSDGNTVIPLTSPKKRYFLCGTPGHCVMGMKLTVNTLAAAASSPSPLPNAAAPPPAQKSRAGTPPPPDSSLPAGPPDASSPLPALSPGSAPLPAPETSPTALSTESKGTTLSPSAAPARGGLGAGRVVGLFVAIWLVLALF